jgi:hypothetical protein
MSRVPVRSVSFDTSFLLRDSSRVDVIIKTLVRHQVPTFITATVLSELEHLKLWGRIPPTTYTMAMKRVRTSKASVIDFKNRLLADAFGAACTRSMEEHLGVAPDAVVNDCRIMVTALKQGVGVFLSEDYHFISDKSATVVTDVAHAACSEFGQLCTTGLYSIDADAFIKRYHDGTLETDGL